MEKYQEIERSIIKKFRKDIWAKFIKALQEYELITENDNIMVCISGGKDSFLLAKLIQEVIRHGKIKFTAHYVVMDPGYNKENRHLIEENAKLLNIPIEIFESDIFDIVTNVSKSPCYLCARMRRGCLYNKAKELGCNKIALGHHFDDVIETILLSILYGGEYKSMPPKLHSTNFPGMELIRPLYLIKEESIKSWQKYNELEFIDCACKMTESIDYQKRSKRYEIKKLIKSLEKINPNVSYNIFKSTENVNIETLLAIKKDNKKISFLDYYNK